MPYTQATSKKKGDKITVTYSDSHGNIEVREGGTRSWRNNNPGNTQGAPGAIGRDYGGFDIFPDFETGNKAKENLLNGKYGNYDSIRQMLKGKFDENGEFINGSGYAPECDKNNPDAYADFIKKEAGIDVDNKKISDLSPEELSRLLDAMRKYEGWKAGSKFNVNADISQGPLQLSDIEKLLGLLLEFFSPNSANASEIFSPFNSAKSWFLPRRCDPLALDLDGDGIETVGTNAGVLFDHNGDGIKTGTGWIKSDDGLLVRDLNGNGSIDNGAELFGDGTRLQNGQFATTGFSALSDLDTVKNGKIDAADNDFAELKIWRDLNQDGISQVNELTTLADLGIAAVNLSSSRVNQSQNGNIIARNGTFARTDGTAGTISDINLASNIFTRDFTDRIEIPEDVAVLPDMTGSGKVRDLREAAAISPELQDIVTRFSSATTYDEQMALIDELLVKWADTSGMAASLGERVGSQYRVEYTAFGSISRAQHLTDGGEGFATSVTNAENPLVDATYRNLIQQWNGRIHVLEAFNGSYFFGLPGQAQEGGGAISGMWIDSTGTTALSEADRNKPGLVITYSLTQLSQLESSYQALKQSVYASLVLQTRLKNYRDLIEINFTAETISLDFTGVSQAFQEKMAADPVNGLADLIEFNNYAGNILREGYWDGVVLMERTIRNQPVTPELAQLYRELNVSIIPLNGNANDNIIVGNSFANTLSGNDGDDILLGGTGSETLIGGSGNDTLSGGAGNDWQIGELGDDTYIFRRGDGNDLVHDSQGKNRIIFSGMNPGDIAVNNSGLGDGHHAWRYG